MVMNEVLEKMEESNSIAITFHTSPDGDSLGSSLALMQALRKMGKDAYILSKEIIPEDFKFLPCSCEIDGSKLNVRPNTECVIVLDCGNTDRINANLDLNNREYVLINIDHHMSNDLYADLNYVDTNAAAVSEIIYQMIRIMGIELDKEIASCLYTSIITDSGSFKYPSTTSVTHTIAGDLINTGIDFSEIHRTIFDNKKFERIKLYGKAIESMKLIDKKICLMTLTKDMLLSLGIEEKTNTSDIISFAMQVEGIEVGILVKETDEGSKVSLRSKSRVDVRKVAEIFGGGGHTMASGCSMDGKNVYEAEKLIVEALKKEFN
ncbi:bifunctional oligoribonuclease/PAP phosphatase NrnA [Clostridium fermenticellae]|uniref:Bifunctional oligoribonuclease/PAP phosphatase NrnA n=1 Tax=Clostridium fermenticellae TaxID=2068654 RepID=A0A386H3F3_9CLOT|nr:bifunctional oligoribonuclease/PAP phosphatase NrnA [Clostridium fermenticellae]AYD40073.1 bifunctional oligoribonuclease/PAP phosphatase NrnA [Clostridium fermenticellae]